MNIVQLIWLFMVVAGVGYLMVYAGREKRMLEPRRVPRLCPSCGRLTRDCRCRG
jgi:hypothetical protein